MSLRYAILGFLSSTPATGYELAREFQQGAGSYWNALPSQIYPELARLETLGWITGRLSTADRLRKRTFRLTRRGQQQLIAWVEGENEYSPERDSERLRLIFLDGSPIPIIRRHLAAHRAHHAGRLAVWQTLRKAVERRTHRQLASRLAKRPKSEHALIVGLKLIALDGNIRRAQGELAWAEQALAWIDTLDHRKRGSRRAGAMGSSP